MKYIILLGDGMADWHEIILKGKTLLQYLDIPNMDWLARCGRNGLLKTVPEGFHPGSEVANSSILGYDQRLVYEGRGPLEAASIGVDLEPGDLALRCNLVSLQGDVLKNHSCGRLETEDGAALIQFLQERLGNERVHFYPGVQYRHLLVVKGGDKRLRCVPPHDIPLKPWRENLPVAEANATHSRAFGKYRDGCLDASGGEEAEETAKLLRSLMEESQKLLPTHPLNLERVAKGEDPANSIWPWGGGYRPQMEPLTKTFPQLRSGAVITAVDLIRGIGKYAGLRVIDVEGATGRWDTDYEAKARAAIEALRTDDFVYLHVEASDEAGHDGDRELKLRTIKDFDQRLVGPVIEALGAKNTDPTADGLNIDGEPVAIALLPDHPTPVKLRTHTAEPVPFCICKPGQKPDGVSAFSEADAVSGAYGLLRGAEFIKEFLRL